MRHFSLEVWQIVIKVHVIKDDLEHGVPTIPNHGKSKKVEVFRLFLTTGIQRRWKSSKRFFCYWTFLHSLLNFPVRFVYRSAVYQMWLKILGWESEAELFNWVLCLGCNIVVSVLRFLWTRWHIYLQFGLFHSAFIFYKHVASMTYPWGRG